jgi:hypothetical protein
MADDPAHPLQPKLESTVEEVREEVSITDAETSELIRIEEALAYASEVAKQATSLRRRIIADDETSPIS